ncbi:Oidioi.mRNA.OKI2018_I69.XSR.g13373.t1.cds [Oikopleura dioica]|uniref:endo-1,4-beta-xylanase n=1 Tax=Oikopleura dioica TaxID=34765 RepID=A0ABN7SAD1_OIKDI|nr:Oidioi.mRNA.OKI2018_I69.XSR.g13373.t1.cds [Oikopleura dioica]
MRSSSLLFPATALASSSPDWSTARWSKCSAPCGIGIQTTEVGGESFNRVCNVESCSIYDEGSSAQFLPDPKMDLPTSSSTWRSTGGSIVAVTEAYDGTDCRAQSALVDHDQELFVAKFFIKLVGEHGVFGVMPQVVVTFASGASKIYLNFGEQSVSAEDGLDNEWFEIAQTRLMTAASDHGITAEQAADESFMTCRFAAVVRDPAITYLADQAYLTTESNLASMVPKEDLLFNGDFEIATDNGLFPIGPGWQSQSNAVLETVYDNDAPSGKAYLRARDRQSTDSGIYQLLDLDEFDRSRPVEFRFWGKFSEESQARAIMEDDGWNKLSLNLVVDYITDGVADSYSMFCTSGCVIPDNQWRQYAGICGLDEWLISTPATVIDQITEVKVKINGAEPGTIMDLDNIRAAPYVRKEEWKAGANLRIDEFRKNNVDIDVLGFPDGSRISFEQLSYEYPWGSKWNWECEEVVPDYKNYFPWYFNYGFITNEMKWQAVERIKGVRDYTKGRDARFFLEILVFISFLSSSVLSVGSLI